MNEPPDEEPVSQGILCTRCVFPNPPDTEFCVRCGMPIGLLATIDPLKQTFSEGFAYRQAVAGSPKLIVVVGMWLLFAPGLLNLPMVVVNRGNDRQPAPVGIAYGLVSAVVLYRTTVGFFRERRRQREMPAAD